MDIKISGIVIHGDGYGKRIGFPTINLKTTDNLPKTGVYFGAGILEGKKYKAGIVIDPKGKLLNFCEVLKNLRLKKN